MLKTSGVFGMEHKVNGHRDLKGTENGRDGEECRHPDRHMRSTMQKTGCNVIEISSSSETEEELCLLSPSSNGLNGSDGDVKSPTECCLQKPMVRRDYGKKTPYRIFQVPVSPKSATAGQEEFYNYLGIHTKPPSSITVDTSETLLKRRSLRVCFIKKLKEHAKLIEKVTETPDKCPMSPDQVKDTLPLEDKSPSPTDPNGTIVERRNYIQITSSQSEEESEVKHKVCDLSHQPNGETTETSITDKTAKRVRDKSRKPKRVNRKIFKTTFSRSSMRKSVLRSGKVRASNSNLHKRLKKRYQKTKKASEIPKPAAKDTKSPEVIVLTDDEDAVEIIKPAETPPPKLTNKVLEQVIGVHLHWPSLLILQQELVSFWTCSEVISLFKGEQNWQKVGEVKRSSNDVDIPAAIGKRIFHTDNFGCVYMELRGRVLQKIASQETDCTSTYVNVYYLKAGEGMRQSIPLDRVCSTPEEMCYTTLPDMVSVFVTWYERATSTKRRTGTCRYSLTPDLETFAKIWDFCAVEHPVRSVSVASDERVIGVGDQHVSIWNYTNGNLLTSIDLTPLALGDNLFTYLVQENKERFLLLAQLHSNTINLVAINLQDFQYFILHTHENVNLAMDAMRTSTVINGVFVGSFAGGEILLLNALHGDCVRRKSVERSKDIFISGENVVEISDKIAIRSLLDFLA